MSGESRSDSQTRNPSLHSVHAVVNWPLRDRPVASTLMLTACGVVGLISGWRSGSGVMGCLAGLAVMLAMWQMWVPIRVEVGPLGLTLSYVRRRRRIAWRDIDHLEPLGDGLSVCGKSTGASRYSLHRLFLPWGRDRSQIALFSQTPSVQRETPHRRSSGSVAAETASRVNEAHS